jgi:hypothetical protein
MSGAGLQGLSSAELETEWHVRCQLGVEARLKQALAFRARFKPLAVLNAGISHEHLFYTSSSFDKELSGAYPTREPLWSCFLSFVSGLLPAVSSR